MTSPCDSAVSTPRDPQQEWCAVGKEKGNEGIGDLHLLHSGGRERGKIWTWIQTHARPATVGAEQGSQQYEALANEGEWVVGDAEARQLLEDAEMADILEDVQAIVAEIEALEERACPHEAAEGYPR